MERITDLDREQLLRLLGDFARNWLSHDAAWFAAVERAHGTDHALELAREAWSAYATTEARRIVGFLGLSRDAGLDGLEKALRLRAHDLLHHPYVDREGDRLILAMRDCRVQAARRQAGQGALPCRSVGMAEYEAFAAAIDPRIQVRAVACPPDEVPGSYSCAWEFWIPA